MEQSLHDFFLFLFFFFSFFFHMGSFRRLSSTMVATFLILATTCMPLSQSAYDVNFTTCNASFHCGNIPQELKYPFWGDGRPDYCGDLAFKIDCPRDNYPEIRILDTEFQVRDVNGSDQRMRISGMNLSDDCPAKFVNPELDDAHFQIAPGLSRILSIYYGCRPEFMRDLPNYVVCGDGYGTFYLDKAESSTYSADLLRNLTNSCSGIADIPINNQNFAKLSRKEIRLFEAINEGFDVKYDTHVAAKCSACESSKGLCGTSLTSDDRFVCFCPDEPHRDHCIVHDGLLLQQKIATAVAAALFVGIVMSIGVCVCHRRKEKKYSNSAVFWMKKEHNPRSIEAFIRDYQSLAPKRYSHVDIKKMTHSFKDKLGQGGYGGVYKGKLLDGRLVAVKVLNSAKGSGEDFINEVASISRTSHVNIVGLMGFCFEGSSRALIYEFMPNGSLEKFIRNDNSSISDDKQLGVELLYKIAIGVAQGLGYLHRGCSTRILHFDIKPHNILLDEDFIPKISDFGLAKLCPSKESIISMMEARGTIGYVAPEVFSRHFGGVSHKSDVYSYGMMILEMVGGKNDINAAALSNSSVTYFPHWIYKRLELQEDLAFHNSMTVAEKDKARRMIIVGLWCIQTDPSHRPSMSKVIEMLTGSSEALQIPPKPFLCSPPRLSPTNSFTASDLEIEL